MGCREAAFSGESQMSEFEQVEEPRLLWKGCFRELWVGDLFSEGSLEESEGEARSLSCHHSQVFSEGGCHLIREKVTLMGDKVSPGQMPLVMKTESLE